MKIPISFFFMVSLSLPLHAGSFTRLEQPITYLSTSEATVSHGQECKVDELLTSRLEQGMNTVSASENKASGTDQAVSGAGDSRLRVQIVHATKGETFAMSGHRYLGIHAEITEHGKRSRQLDFSRTCNLAGMSAFNKCQAFDICADMVTKSLLWWVKNPNYRVPQGTLPAQAK